MLALGMGGLVAPFCICGLVVPARHAGMHPRYAVRNVVLRMGSRQIAHALERHAPGNRHRHKCLAQQRQGRCNCGRSLLPDEKPPHGAMLARASAPRKTQKRHSGKRPRRDAP